MSPVRHIEGDARIKPVAEKLDVPRAFDETGLHLAKFVAEYYLCTLGEALSAAVLSGAIPRVVDTFVRAVSQPNPQRYPSVPARLVRLIWEEFPDGFALETFLRHPEARRTGDRAALLRYVQNVVRSGELRRERHFVDPRTHEYRDSRALSRRNLHQGTQGRSTARVRPRAARRTARRRFARGLFERRHRSRGEKRRARRTRNRARRVAQATEPAPPPFPPTEEQRRALEAINGWLDAKTFAEALIHGVTGSGKTYVYVEAIKRVVREGGRAIVLVPEISLTPQTARRFEEAFGERVAVLHSALSERERFDAWQACMRGEIDVVVGARSAVFAPLAGRAFARRRRSARNVVQARHRPALSRGHRRARTHARRRRHFAARQRNAVARESYEAALRGRIALIELTERATAQSMPAVTRRRFGKRIRSRKQTYFQHRARAGARRAARSAARRRCSS